MPRPGGTLYASGHLLFLARRSYDRIESRHDSQITVLLSAVCLEAVVHDQLPMARNAAALGRSPLAASLSNALTAAERNREPMLAQLAVAHAVLTGDRIAKGNQPYQDVRLLAKVRNMIVHTRPEYLWRTHGEEAPYYPPVVRQFMRRGLIPEPEGGAKGSWQSYVMVPAVARWSHNTTVRAAKWIASWVPSSDVDLAVAFNHVDLWTEL